MDVEAVDVEAKAAHAALQDMADRRQVRATLVKTPWWALAVPMLLLVLRLTPHGRAALDAHTRALCALIASTEVSAQ